VISSVADTVRFGGERVTQSDVLHVVEGNPKATIVGDLSAADHIPSCSFDCVIFPQILHLIYESRAALATIHRILRPGGALLLTAPGITPIDMGEWSQTWYWSFTPLSLERMLSEVFSGEGVAVESDGNLLSATAFLQGLSAEELRAAELDHRDDAFPVIITARAVKAGRQSLTTAGGTTA
jgi:SAM-dependent methyltransferase